MLNAAFLTMGKDIGGAKNDVITLSTALAQNGHRIFVLAMPGVMDQELAGTKVQFIPAPFHTRNPWGLWKASRILRKIIRSEGIELINPQGMFTAAIAWLAHFGIGRIPFKIVTTIHMFSRVSQYKWAWMLNIFSEKVITESFCERNRLLGGGVKFDRIHVIANSVDMKKFSRELSTPVLRSSYHLTDDVPTFGIIARLSPEKRHADYIAAARLVHEKYPQARFFIIGDGPCREEIEKLRQGAENYILMTGVRRDIPNILCSLNCYVLCSRIESLPLSIREAMAMKTVIIVTDVGGNREAVIDGLTGWVVPAYSPESLAKKMIWIIENPERAAEMAEEGHVLCRKCFEVSQWAEQTEKEFHSVLGGEAKDEA